jgi:hypothetical protein
MAKSDIIFMTTVPADDVPDLPIEGPPSPPSSPSPSALLLRARFASMRDNEGNTLLHWAVARNEPIERIKALIVACGIDVNAQNYQGQSALFLAAAQGVEQVVFLLLVHGANPNLATLEGMDKKLCFFQFRRC